jgi:hypothetical protein
MKKPPILVEKHPNRVREPMVGVPQQIVLSSQDPVRTLHTTPPQSGLLRKTARVFCLPAPTMQRISQLPRSTYRIESPQAVIGNSTLLLASAVRYLADADGQPM